MNTRIKELRKQLELTQQEFADRLGVKRNTVASYETGKSNPSDAAVRLICREFNVNEDWLRTGRGEMFNSHADTFLSALAQEYHLSNSAYVALEKFLKLKPELQQGVVNYFLEVANALSDSDTPAAPDTGLSTLSIDERVDLYRQELEREEKAGGESEAS